MEQELPISDYEIRRLLKEKEEREKELACIHDIAKILNNSDSIDWAMQQIVTILPSAFGFPNKTLAQILYNNVTYHSKNFVHSDINIQHSFFDVDNEEGKIEVSFLREDDTYHDYCFSTEEINVVNTVACLITGYINEKKARYIIGVTDNNSAEPEDDENISSKMLLQKFLDRHNAERNSLYYLNNYHKVKDILLVANLYDAYSIEGEGRLLSNILENFRQFSFSSLPRITGATNEKEVFEKLKLHHYDLVIIMIGNQVISSLSICKKIKEEHSYIPIFLLLSRLDDISLINERCIKGINFDNLFAWTGDVKIFSAMISLLEDKLNLDGDTKKGFMRAILLIEDSPAYYSSYLPMLYSMIMEQTKTLIGENPTEESKTIKLRTRPKILFASTWEEAMLIYQQYKENLLCVISDMSFSINGEISNTAGYEFVKQVKTDNPKIPAVLQSADPENAKYAFSVKCNFINKNSNSLFQDLKSFINYYIGFGQFIFRDAKGHQVATANSMKEFETAIASIPDSSIIFHASRNNFSSWLMARGEIQVAKIINAKKYSVNDTPAAIREFLLNVIKEHKQNINKGRIVNFEESAIVDETNVVSLMPGSLGGKGRGLAFINTLIYSFELGKHLPGINIKTPITSVIGTDEFDLFMDRNHLWEVIKEDIDFPKLQEIFINGELSFTLEKELRILLKQVEKPIAVRSSSMFEDSMSKPFSGIFSTYILPNNHPDFETRFKQLSDAIKLVFVSVYSRCSRTYFDAINFKVEQEKMAVVIQEVVGNRFGDTFYPHISGTAQSFNFYPVAHIKPEDGFSVIAAGLGQYVVEGERAYRFCPVYPDLDIVSHTDLYKNSQVNFYAVDLAKKELNLLEGENAGLISLDISVAEEHNTLRHLVSVLNPDNDMLIPGLDYAGPRVVNFANILKYNYIPLSSTIRTILDIVSEAIGSPAEIEFAVDLTKDKNGKASFYLLQIKPLFGIGAGYDINVDATDNTALLLRSDKSMGNGAIDTITDVIYIEPDKFDKMHTVDMAVEIEQLNLKMMNEKRQYVLIGPGRWGSRDIFLGIPVVWSQISNAKVIVEVGLPGFHLDASLGSHFFHNVTSMNVGYFSVNCDTNSGLINWNVLNTQKIIENGKYFKHIRFNSPLSIKMDGKKGIAIISIPSNN